MEKKDYFESFKISHSTKNKNESYKDSDKNSKSDYKNEEIEEEDGEESEHPNLTRSETIINKLVKIEKDKIRARGKLLVDEDMSSGKIGFHIYKVIIEYSGGYIQIIMVFIFAIIWQFTIIEGNIYLANWSKKIDINDDDENIYHFMIYTLFGIACIFSLF